MEGGEIKLSDGKRELLASEVSELWETSPTGLNSCSYLTRLTTPGVGWDECDKTLRYLCEFKGNLYYTKCVYFLYAFLFGLV